MKKIIKFQKSETDYQIVDDEKVLFTIDIKEMKFDVKEFYYAFFAEIEDLVNIEIENTVEEDKNATRVYKCIRDLFSEILKRFNDEIVDVMEE